MECFCSIKCNALTFRLFIFLHNRLFLTELMRFRFLFLKVIVIWFHFLLTLICFYNKHIHIRRLQCTLHDSADFGLIRIQNDFLNLIIGLNQKSFPWWRDFDGSNYSKRIVKNFAEIYFHLWVFIEQIDLLVKWRLQRVH